MQVKNDTIIAIFTFEQGAACFDRDGLAPNPDVVPIDYGRADRGRGLSRANAAAEVPANWPGRDLFSREPPPSICAKSCCGIRTFRGVWEPKFFKNMEFLLILK